MLIAADGQDLLASLPAAVATALFAAENSEIAMDLVLGLSDPHC